MINRSSTDHVGFFGYVNGATIENLTIEGSSVFGNNNVGGMIGYIAGATVTNCHVKLTGNFGVNGVSCVGSLAGYSANTTYNTFSASASVTSPEKTGGFIGYVDNGTFTDGTFSGTVVGTGNYTGGLFGWATGCTLTNISVNGTITGQDYTGGIMGYCATGSLTSCTYEGNLSGEQYVGGLSGSLETSTTSFADCFTKGKITGSGDYVGGIVGISKGACIESMENCSHFGDIDGQSYVGGLVGALISGVEAPTLHEYEVRNYDGRTLGWYYETMTSGSSTSKIVNNCTVIGNVNGNSYIGGLIGLGRTANGYTSKKVYGSNSWGYSEHYIYEDQNYIGWFRYNNFGYYTYTRQSISLDLINSYYSGTIHGSENVGGLVGYKSGGTLQYNYAYATIYGSSNVGGIVGKVSGEKVSDSYNTTTIKSNVSINSIVSASSSNVGRIYGIAEYAEIGALASAEGNRALTQTRVILQGVIQEVDDDFQNGNSTGPSALKLKANYVSWGWDFDNNWNNLETESYPYKKYQAAPPIIKSDLVSQNTTISGKSLNNGTVYLYYKDHDAVSTICSGNNWSFSTEALQSGAQVKVYADVEGMTPSYFATSYVGYPGSGTEEDPFRIYTAEDLQGASNQGYYKLMNDIDLTTWINENSPTKGWPAIGRNSGEMTYIDGDNHKVTGLWMNTNENYNGLFSNFSAGEIKNLKVVVASGKKVKGGDYTGVLIGRNANGSIINCTISGDVEGTVHTGGIAGYVEGSTLRHLSYTGNVSSAADNAFIGGMIGQTLNCEISACEANATMNATGKGNAEGENGFFKIGGLVGESKGGTISQCKAQNNLTATGENGYAGGLAGYSESHVTQSVSTGTVTASGSNSYTGGLVGYALAGIDNSYSTAQTTGSLFTGGLVGYTFNAIDKCYAKGNVYGVRFGAGIVAELDGQNATLTNSVACCNIVSLTDQAAWGCRVVGGFMNGAEEPDESNYALSTMQVSVNGEPENKTDDNVEGKAMTEEALNQKSTYEQLGWNFSKIWAIEEGEGYPTLQSNGLNGGGDDPDPNDDPNHNTDPDPNTGTIEPTDISSMSHVIYIDPVEEVLGVNQIVLSIKMKNRVPIRAFQFDLYLPTGVTAAKSEKGRILCSLSNGRLPEDDEHTLTVSEQADGALRFLCGSQYDENFTGNDGEIVTLTVNIAENVAAGDHPIIMKNMKLTETDISNYYEIAYVQSVLSLSSFMLGDINSDRKVDVSDYIGVANHILGDIPDGFVEKAGDVDQSGVIDVMDYIGIANLILTGSIYGNKTSTLPKGMKPVSNTENVNELYLEPLSAVNGKQAKLSVRMRNSAPIRGFQFNLCLPDGVTVAKTNTGKMKASLNENRLPDEDKHTINGAVQDDGSVLFLCGSQYDDVFTGSDGEVASITLNVDNNMDVDDYSVLLKTIKLTESDISKYYEKDQNGATMAVRPMGDANGDKHVTETDPVNIVGFILGDNPANFIKVAADMNGDGVITVADIVLLIDKISNNQ